MNPPWAITNPMIGACTLRVSTDPAAPTLIIATDPSTPAFQPLLGCPLPVDKRTIGTVQIRERVGVVCSQNLCVPSRCLGVVQLHRVR